MARGFVPSGRTPAGEPLYVALLDPEERDVVLALLHETRLVVDPEAEVTPGLVGPVPSSGPEGAQEGGPVDVFSQIVGRLGMDDVVSPDAGGVSAPVPDDAATLADRDPALARLLPPGHADDEVAADFRRLTEQGLRARKAESLRASCELLARAELPRLEVAEPRAHLLAAALTDARVVLAERLGLRTDEDAEALHARLDAAEDVANGVVGRGQPAPSLDARAAAAELALMGAYYDFLSWLQESLTLAMLGDIPAEG